MDNSSVFPHGIKTGVIAGVAAILVTLLAYVLNINMLGWTFQGVSYLVLIGVMIYGLLGFRKANGGYMAFAQGILIVLVAGMLRHHQLLLRPALLQRHRPRIRTASHRQLPGCL